VQFHRQAQARAIFMDCRLLNVNFRIQMKNQDNQTNIVEAARKKLERAISPKHSQPKNVRKQNITVSPTGSSKSSFGQLPFVPS